MFNEVLVCLDGSSFAERVIPFARAIAEAARAKLTFLRIIQDEAEFSAAWRYVEHWARLPNARAKILPAQVNVWSTILEELRPKPNVMPAITTHGRTGLLESLLGSVALSVIRGAGRPVLLYRPGGTADPLASEREVKITSVVTALDGSEFSEKIVPFAAELAGALKSTLKLVQALPASGGSSRLVRELQSDILEGAYLHKRAGEVGRRYRLDVDWDVLHGDAAKAVCAYVKVREDLILAMTSRARAGLEKTIFGSVAGECLRHAGVPMLIYWPGQ